MADIEERAAEWREGGDIHDAAMEGDVEKLRSFLAAGVDPDRYAVVQFEPDSDAMSDEDDGSDPWRCTPLQAVCAEEFPADPAEDDGHAACVAALLEAGADPNAVDNGGKNALLLAAFSGRCRLGLMLVAAGATVDPNYKALIYEDDDEFQPHGVLDILFKYCPGHHSYCPTLMKNMVLALLSAGVSIAYEDSTDPGGVTTLEHAIWLQHRRLWPLLFRLGSPHPRHWQAMPSRHAKPCYGTTETRRMHPYLRKIDAAGSYANYERAHLKRLTAIFSPKLTCLPEEIVALVVGFWADVGAH